MYLLFKSVDERTLGPIQVVGTWYDYKFGYIPDTHKDIIPYQHLNPRILDEDVALAWPFISAYRDYINVRPGTPQNLQLNVVQSHEATGEKERYTLTDDDISNTVLLIKEIMRCRLDEIYDRRMVAANINVSLLESSSWEKQKEEALEYDADNTVDTPLLSALANARSITVDEMVQKVLDAISAYNTSISDLLAAKQAVENDIKSCQSIADCHRLMHNRFEISMSAQQMEEEGITTSATFDV